ncbi:MAG TPA: glycosyltransferase family 4 protein [Chloroflexota bacterium]|nr:glycosyltransferase family 4 protein [Chloroflexota bacterium]
MSAREPATGRQRGRIAMVSHCHYLADPRVRRQAEALAAHGYAVEVICQRQPGEPAVEQRHGVTVRRVGGAKYRGPSLGRYVLTYGRFFLQALATVTREHCQQSYAAVQVYSMPEALLLTALWPRLAGVPLIYDAGDLTSDLYTAKFGARGGPLAAALLRAQERWCLRLADLVVTVHEEYRQRLLARGVPAERLLVVMNLPDERLFYPRPRPATHAVASVAPPGTFTLVFHGTLVARYGVDLAVEAVARLRERLPGLQLRIYGDGDLRPRLVQLIAALGLENQVFLSPGYVPLEEIPALLAAADAAVVPTRVDAFTETILPNKLLEYLALGLPTVVTRTRTVVAHVPETAVEYCAPDDVEALARAIERLYTDPARRAALAAGARAFSATHRWADAAAAYCAAVDTLVARRRSGARLSHLRAATVRR